MSETIINCPAGFFQDDPGNPTTLGDLVSAVATADNLVAEATAAQAAAAASAVGVAEYASSAFTSSLAAASSATAAGTSETNAASSATSASTSATSAASSATSAASSATSASTSATSAGTSATSATTSASGASTSATAASNSASAASASATAAAASAALIAFNLTTANVWTAAQTITQAGNGQGSAAALTINAGAANAALSSGVVKPIVSIVNTPNVYQGSLAAGQTGNLNQILITNDQLDATTHSVGGVRAMTVQHVFGTSGMKGGRQALSVALSQTADSGNATGGTTFYTALYAQAQSNSVDGGTSGTPTGNLFASNFLAQLTSGAVHWNQVVGQEIDVSVASGASCAFVVGLQVVRFLNDAVAGSAGKDNAIQIANSPSGSSPGWNKGLSFGASSGWWPMASTGTLIGTDPGFSGTPSYNATFGIDFSSVTFATAFLKSTGFSVDGSGNVVAVSIGNGSTALQIKGTGSFSANGSVATTMTSLGPTGSHTTVQEWLTIKDNSGTTRYIPCY